MGTCINTQAHSPRMFLIEIIHARVQESLHTQSHSKWMIKENSRKET